MRERLVTRCRHLVPLIAVLAAAGPALAQARDAAPPEAIPPPAPSPAAEYPAGTPAPTPSGEPASFAPWKAWKADLKERGVDFTLSYRSEDLAAVSGAESSNLVHAGQIALTSKFDMDRLTGWSGASINASITYRDGDNINDKSGVAALLGPQEIFGRGHYLRLSEFWLDQSLFDKRIELRLGRVSPGADFQATECSFTNLSFCANQEINYVADVWYGWPISQQGAVAKFNFDTDKYVKVGAYQINPRNLRGDFWAVLSPKGGTGVLAPFEFGWTPTFADGRIGEYKIGGWYSSAKRQDVYRDIAGGPASASGLPFREHDGSYGAFMSIVQQITRGDRRSEKSGLRAIFKASVSDKATSTVDRSIVGTFVYTGPFAVRPADDVGVAIGFNHLNDRVAHYRAEQLALDLPGPLPGGTERTIEAYYSLRFGSIFMFRPDIQWIHSPGGISERKDVWITGMRTEITF